MRSESPSDGVKANNGWRLWRRSRSAKRWGDVLYLLGMTSSTLISSGQVHFRPLVRSHTDPSLGHCSYLNTCYSEPTYAQSPSIPPPPSSQNPHGGAGRIGNLNAVSLPSGLGAGGRGKEKAPCRYLHFEVDYDGFPGEGGTFGTATTVTAAPKLHTVVQGDDVTALGIGLGPTGHINKALVSGGWLATKRVE